MLSYMDFPNEHRLRIRANNVIERLNRKVRRRTRLVGYLPRWPFSLNARLFPALLRGQYALAQQEVHEHEVPVKPDPRYRFCRLLITLIIGLNSNPRIILDSAS